MFWAICKIFNLSSNPGRKKAVTEVVQINGGRFKIMSTKRKGIAQLKSKKKPRKELKGDGVDKKSSTVPVSWNNTPLSDVKCDKVTMQKSSITSKPKGLCFGGTIINCFRKQQEEELRSVNCPVCGRLVLFRKINEHLDGGCREEGMDDPQLQRKVKSSSQDRMASIGDQTVGSNGTKECGGSFGVLSESRDVIHRNESDITSTSVAHSSMVGMTSLSAVSTLNSCKQSINNNPAYSYSRQHADSQDSLKDMGTKSEDTSTRDISMLLTDLGRTDVNLENVKLDHLRTNHNSKTLNHIMTYSQSQSLVVEGMENSIDNGDMTNSWITDQSGTQNNNDDMITSDDPDDHAVMTQNEDISPNSHHEPYYLHNFLLTLNTVLCHKDDKELFDERDNMIVESFRNLCDGAQRLYVRLFQRKFKWFRQAKIQYPQIGEDLQPFFRELIEHGFIKTEAGLVDLEEALKLLPASDVVDLARSMHVINRSDNQSKKQLVTSLLKHSKNQCSLFANNGDRIAKAIVKRAKTLLGPCVKLDVFPRNVFSRVVLLFTLNLLADDDDNTGSQLSALFLINIGRIVYPTYEISRDTPVFSSREELIKYELANQDLCRMDDAIENKNFDQARCIYERVREQFLNSLSDLAKGKPQMMNAVKLPLHLRRFTCTWLYTKMCSRGVELLQRNKDYPGAVDLLRRLLHQNEFCVSHRGWWWERLALNLDQHLKRPAEALDAVRSGLADSRVRTGHRFALEQRAKKICEAKRNSSLRKHLSEIRFTELKQPRIVTISGKRLTSEPVFVLHEVNTDGSIDGDVVSYCGVEEMALRHYRKQGFNEGIHGEGSTFNTLFGLLMWDVIFARGIPDVFRTPFQAAPLDIFCDDFYVRRKEVIDRRLDEIRTAPVEKIVEWLELTWQEQQGKTCVGVNWDLFSGIEQIKELVRCIGGYVLAGIFERFAKDHRHTRSGLPDLVVWSSNSLKYKVLRAVASCPCIHVCRRSSVSDFQRQLVEVKGPNDRLSSKQHVWLDALVSLGVDAEVLYVKADWLSPLISS